jgi:hypothetical protein
MPNDCDAGTWISGDFILRLREPDICCEDEDLDWAFV